MNKVVIEKCPADQQVYGTKFCLVVWIKGDYSTLKSFSTTEQREAEDYAGYLKRIIK